MFARAMSAAVMKKKVQSVKKTAETIASDKYTNEIPPYK